MKKRYILNGFESKDKAQERNHQFAKLAGVSKPGSITKYMFPVHCLVQEQWGLELTEDDLYLLKDEEKYANRLKEIPHQPFVNSYVPMVFRYLEEEWVEEFFKDGSLRISSFSMFRKHSHQERSDIGEGKNVIQGNAEDISFYATTEHGNNAYVLSTSLISNQQLMKDFGVNSGFVIEQPFLFMQEVSKQIPDYLGIRFGPCLYLDNKTIRRTVNTKLENLKQEGDIKGIDMNKMFSSIHNAGGQEVYFSKLTKYAHQHEYRMLWHSGSKSLPDYLDLKVPEARQYCRKISL